MRTFCFFTIVYLWVCANCQPNLDLTKSWSQIAPGSSFLERIVGSPFTVFGGRNRDRKPSKPNVRPSREYQRRPYRIAATTVRIPSSVYTQSYRIIEQTPQPVILPVLSRKGVKLVCRGRVHYLESDAAHFYSCCGKEIYYWPNETCTHRTTTTTRAPAPVIPEEEAVFKLGCGGMTYSFYSLEMVKKFGCCGERAIVLGSEKCDLPNEQPESEQTNNGAIKGPLLCSQGYLCCDGYKPVINIDRKYRCCPNAGPFNPDIQVCLA